jgi:hypothetical protein
MNVVKVIILMTMLALLPATGHAKWWIFGQSENEISTRYLYLNGISYDELGDKVTVYRETLEQGQLILRGKAATTSSTVGSVQVSINGKESWDKARKTADGSFEYAFRPETGKQYVLFVKIIDTTGKTNDVDATRKEVVVSDRNISALIRQAMDELVAAYRAEDPARFMALISPEFAADPTVLDRAIRRDFTYFDQIDLRYTLNNVTSAPGKVYAAFTFSRKLTATRTGQTLSDTGSSEFVFTLGEKGPLVFSMKNPLIFGLSDASNVATGTVNTGTNEPIIVVTSSGDVITQPFTEAIETINNDGVPVATQDLVESGSFTLNSGCEQDACFMPGFAFASQEMTTYRSGDINLETNLMFIRSGIGMQNLGGVGLNTVTSAPASGYAISDGTGLTAFNVGDNIGNTFAFQLTNGRYALLEVVSYTDFGQAITRSTFRFKYQPNGTRLF